MAELRWHPDSDGYAANGFRIRRIVGHARYHWRLEKRTRLGAAEAAEWATVSYHGSLRGAHFRANSIEHERLRRDRTLVRLAVGVLALAVFLTAIGVSTSLVSFLVMVISSGVAVAVFGSALAVHFDDWSVWGDGPTTTMTWLDRLAAPLLRSLRRRTPQPGTPEETEPVRVLPPRPPMLRGGP